MAVDVPVSLPSLLHGAASGKGEVTVTAETFEGALETLLERYPLLRRHLYEADGTLREHVNIFWNDQNIRWLDDPGAPLRQGDTITILQAVSGG
jgi:molybdopterin converting factor small subunit